MSGVLFCFREAPRAASGRELTSTMAWTLAGGDTDPEIDGAWRWPERGREGRPGASVDLFSPPECWRDSAGRWRRSRRPADSIAVEGAARDAGEETRPVEVLGIVRVSFPWQLVGYAAAGHDPLGLFRNMASGELVWRRSGGTLGKEDYMIERMQVGLDAVASDSEGAAAVRVATAEVKDRWTRHVVELCTREWRAVGAPRAELRLAAAGFVRALAEGERVEDGDAVIEVEDVDLRRQRVVVRASRGAERSRTPVVVERVPIRWQLAWNEAREGAER